MTINFNAFGFRDKHGYMPRGTAYWSFYFADAPTIQWRPSSERLTYLEAKRLATVEARRRNVTKVRVDPNPEELRADE